jgi:Phenazine biosynthesis-like protein
MTQSTSLCWMIRSFASWSATTLRNRSGATTVLPMKLSCRRPSRTPRKHRYLHYDVFTDSPLTGNQLVVFTDPAGLDTETMARMTCEMNFSECTFVFPSGQTDTDVRLRIFGLGGEMPFAGHPVIGSTFALAYEHIIKPRARRRTQSPQPAVFLLLVESRPRVGPRVLLWR